MQSHASGDDQGSSAANAREGMTVAAVSKTAATAIAAE
jgi:hypothetical protein